jgi:hypothetical protein
MTPEQRNEFVRKLIEAAERAKDDPISFITTIEENGMKVCLPMTLKDLARLS